jgi:hypothetical protein
VGSKRAKGLVFLSVVAFLVFLVGSALGAQEGWLSPGQSFQTKVEKGKVLTVKAKTKKGIVCVLLKCGKKDFDWDLANNEKRTAEPFQLSTPEKATFTLKVDHSDHPEGRIWYSYALP